MTSTLNDIIERRARCEAIKQAQIDIDAIEATLKEALGKVGINIDWCNDVHKFLNEARQTRVDDLVHARLQAVADQMMAPAKSTAPTFKLDDKVVLNSGGPNMTVVELLLGGVVTCRWYTQGSVNRAQFPSECLVKADSDADGNAMRVQA